MRGTGKPTSCLSRERDGEEKGGAAKGGKEDGGREREREKVVKGKKVGKTRAVAIRTYFGKMQRKH